MTNTTHIMVQVECSCNICKVNAAKLGKSLPLRAEVDPRFLAALKGKAHAAVCEAHHPIFGSRTAAVRAL